MFKIVPMEGDLLVNGERQKGAADMLAEVEIALALSALRGPLGASRSPCTGPAAYRGRIQLNQSAMIDSCIMR